MVSQHQDLWRRKEPIKSEPLELPLWASKMAPRGKVPLIKSENLRLVPGTTWQKERIDYRRSSSGFRVSRGGLN